MSDTPRHDDSAEAPTISTPTVCPTCVGQSAQSPTRQYDENADLSLAALHEAEASTMWFAVGTLVTCAPTGNTFDVYTAKRAQLIVALRNAYADGSLRPYPDALIEAADALLFAIEHEGKHALKSTMLLNALATYRCLREGE